MSEIMMVALVFMFAYAVLVWGMYSLNRRLDDAQTVILRGYVRDHELYDLRRLVKAFFDARARRCDNCDYGDNSAQCECIEIGDALEQAEDKLREAMTA